MISQELIKPSSIAIIKGGGEQETISYNLVKNLIFKNFAGNIFVVGNDKNIPGVQTYSQIMPMPDADLAIIASDNSDMLSTIETLCEKKGCRAIIICPSKISGGGLSESQIYSRIENLKANFPVTILGPNSGGIANSAYCGVYSDISLAPNGVLDIISSSRTTISYIVENASRFGLGISSAISVGRGCWTTIEDVLEWMDINYQPTTEPRTIAIYIEKITDTNALLLHCNSLISKGYGIVAIKGAEAEEAIKSDLAYTGIMVSHSKAITALFTKCGIIRAFSREDMLNIAAILSKPRPNGKRTVILTQSGGPAVMLAEVLKEKGFTIPQIYYEEAKTEGNAGQISSLIDKYNSNRETDSIAVIFGEKAVSDTTEVFNVLFRKIAKTKLPIYPLFPLKSTNSEYVEQYHAQGGVTFSDEVIFANSLSSVVSAPDIYRVEAPPAIDKYLINNVIEQAQDGWLSPFMVEQILDAAGIARVTQIFAIDEDEAVEAAISIGYPVVMKVVGPLHKAVVDGVSLNISDEHTLRSEYRRMKNIKDVNGVVLQPMLNKQNLELFIGAKRDSNLGVLVMFGLSGIFVEALRDCSLCVAPITSHEADNMIESLKSYPLIQGYSGHSGVNVAMINETLRRVSALCMAIPQIVEMDLNPIFGDEDGVIAAGARIKIEKI